MLYDEWDVQAEAENRIRNLMWTVSGDYALDTKPDVESYEKSKYVSLYDAVKQGAFARFFDKNAFALYLVKKVYCGADEQPLAELAQLCVDAASYPRIAVERPGVPELREKAFSDLLDDSFHRMSQSLPGQIKIALIRSSLYEPEPYASDCPVGAGAENVRTASSEERNNSCIGGKRVREAVARIRMLEAKSGRGCGDQAAADTMDIIRTVDELYNTLIDKGFERKHGDLKQVLDVTLEELQEYDWSDFLKEELSEDALDAYFNKMNQAVTTIREEPDEKPEPKKAKRKVIVIDEEAARKMYSYIELNFGRSYLTEQEQKQKNQRLCRGAHADCSLYFTDGVLENPVLSNAQYVNARRHAEKNRVYFRNHANMM
ncbi:MAG: nitric oxide reductase activation protein, partial [Lachnospiraceae bacterium]|nr:nitric oxide reductase activation protein [Lachnospiraceae bacterium]